MNRKTSLRLKNMDAVHGFLREETWAAPIKVLHNDEEARPGYESMKRHEYNEVPDTLHAKVQVLAQLLRNSTNAIVYTGAGISTASGIKDYATKMESSTIARNRPKITSNMSALPTFAHHAVTALHREEIVKYWIQQNHDGLPQKAGFPQKYINEIHGAWYDPSNPVVKFSGDLRDDYFEDILEWEERTDLCIAMGTSLSGMNCDRVVETVGEKARHGQEGCLGAVIIGIQRTRLDNISALRIFAPIDDVMELLLSALSIESRVPRALVPQPYDVPLIPEVTEGTTACFGKVAENTFQIPYSKETGLLQNNGNGTIIDLSTGAQVKLTAGPYEGDVGTVEGRTATGHYKLRFTHNTKKKSGKTVREQRLRTMGFWWVDGAVKGEVHMFPVMNVSSRAPPTRSTKMVKKKK